MPIRVVCITIFINKSFQKDSMFKHMYLVCSICILVFSVAHADTLFELSDQMNARVALPDSNYPISILYSDYFNGDYQACSSPDNSLFWLHSSTNSRIQTYPSETYSIPICAESVHCQVRSSCF